MGNGGTGRGPRRAPSSFARSRAFGSPRLCRLPRFLPWAHALPGTTGRTAAARGCVRSPPLRTRPPPCRPPSQCPRARPALRSCAPRSSSLSVHAHWAPHDPALLPFESHLLGRDVPLRLDGRHQHRASRGVGDLDPERSRTGCGRSPRLSDDGAVVVSACRTHRAPSCSVTTGLTKYWKHSSCARRSISGSVALPLKKAIPRISGQSCRVYRTTLSNSPSSGRVVPLPPGMSRAMRARQREP